MPITCLCGSASLSSAASVCSCLTWGPWSSVSLTPSCLVRLTSSLWTNVLSCTPTGWITLKCTAVIHQRISHHLQERWFSSWHSLPSFTVGWMLLQRCSALLTGCFTRYLSLPLQHVLLFTTCPILYFIIYGLCITGLVEFNVFCQLLSHLERSGPWLAVLLCVPGLPVGQWLYCFQAI